MIPKTLTVEDLAEILHMEPKSLHNRVYQRPETLPESLKIPGSRRVLWFETTVLKWLKECSRA